MNKWKYLLLLCILTSFTIARRRDDDKSSNIGRYRPEDGIVADIIKRFLENKLIIQPIDRPFRSGSSSDSAQRKGSSDKKPDTDNSREKMLFGPISIIKNG